MQAESLYEIFGLLPSSEWSDEMADEVESAYSRLYPKLRPGKGGLEEDTMASHRISLARETLLNAEKRQRYNTALEHKQEAKAKAKQVAAKAAAAAVGVQADSDLPSSISLRKQYPRTQFIVIQVLGDNVFRLELSKVTEPFRDNSAELNASIFHGFKLHPFEIEKIKEPLEWIWVNDFPTKLGAGRGLVNTALKNTILSKYNNEGPTIVFIEKELVRQKKEGVVLTSKEMETMGVEKPLKKDYIELSRHFNNYPTYFIPYTYTYTYRLEVKPPGGVGRLDEKLVKELLVKKVQLFIKMQGFDTKLFRDQPDLVRENDIVLEITDRFKIGTQYPDRTPESLLYNYTFSYDDTRVNTVLRMNRNSWALKQTKESGYNARNPPDPPTDDQIMAQWNLEIEQEKEKFKKSPYRNVNV